MNKPRYAPDDFGKCIRLRWKEKIRLESGQGKKNGQEQSDTGCVREGGIQTCLSVCISLYLTLNSESSLSAILGSSSNASALTQASDIFSAE